MPDDLARQPSKSGSYNCACCGRELEEAIQGGDGWYCDGCFTCAYPDLLIIEVRSS